MKTNNILFLCMVLLTINCKQKTIVPNPIAKTEDKKIIHSEHIDSLFKIEGYVDSLNLRENLHNNCSLFFTVDKQDFLIKNENKDSIFLYQKIKNSWEKQFKVYANFELNRFDFNLDGYPDFMDNNQREFEVYLYNPFKKCFSKKPFTVSVESGIIDSAKKIFYTHYMQISTNGESELFTIKGDTAYYLNGVSINGKTEQSDTIKILSLYKNINGDENNSKKIYSQETNLDNWSFDYENFWRNYVKNKKIVLAQKAE
jgi:hypothetical protein